MCTESIFHFALATRRAAAQAGIHTAPVTALCPCRLEKQSLLHGASTQPAGHLVGESGGGASSVQGASQLRRVAGQAGGARAERT